MAGVYGNKSMSHKGNSQRPYYYGTDYAAPKKMDYYPNGYAEASGNMSGSGQPGGRQGGPSY